MRLARRLSCRPVAKDTEKLIRQLSLISFLMAQGRPVSALEIKREVEGYSDMNDDAFARRFYADRAELESLGIKLGVEKPGEGFFEAELYSLPPENFYLTAIEFSDDELAALRTALLAAHRRRLRLRRAAAPGPAAGRLGPPEPAQRGRARPGRDGDDRLGRRPRALAAPVEDRDRDLAPQDDRVHLLHDGARRDREAQGRPLPPRLPRRPVLFDRPLARARRGPRLPPLADPGQGRLRVQGRARLLPARGLRPPRLRPAAPTGSWARSRGTAKIFLRERIAWLIERDFGAYGEIRPAKKSDGAPGKGRVFETDYASPARADRLGAALAPERRGARLPTSCARRPRAPSACCATRHENGFEPAETVDRPLREAPRARALQRPRRGGDPPRALRPPRHPRRPADRSRRSRASASRVAELRDRLKLTDEELREDIEVLNVVNFGGGTYVLYAEIIGDEIEVDSEPYGDNFARPARLLPLEAKALVAAIDLFGDHLPQGGLQSAPREDRRSARPRPLRGGAGDRPAGGGDAEVARIVNEAIADSRVLELQLLQGERGPVHQARGRALPARERPRGLVRRVLRPGQRGRPPLQARPDQGGRRSPSEASSRAPRSRRWPGSRAG